jgi:hypothetical protein
MSEAQVNDAEGSRTVTIALRPEHHAWLEQLMIEEELTLAEAVGLCIEGPYEAYKRSPQSPARYNTVAYFKRFLRATYSDDEIMDLVHLLDLFARTEIARRAARQQEILLKVADDGEEIPGGNKISSW